MANNILWKWFWMSFYDVEIIEKMFSFAMTAISKDKKK